jgi:hypothetical protein
MKRGICKVSKYARKHKGVYAVHGLACRLIEAADSGKHFMLNENPCFTRARKIAKTNGVLLKYDSKTADYFAVKNIDNQKG